MQDRLLAYLLGGLDADEINEVEVTLERDAVAAELIEQMRAAVLLLQFDKELFEAPTGLAQRTSRRLRQIIIS